MFGEHMLFFVPSRIGISYKVKKGELSLSLSFVHDTFSLTREDAQEFVLQDISLR